MKGPELERRDKRKYYLKKLYAGLKKKKKKRVLWGTGLAQYMKHATPDRRVKYEPHNECRDDSK